MDAFKSLLSLAVLLIAVISTQALAADRSVVVAMLPSPSNAGFMVALESGFFKGYGLEVVPVQFSGGTQTTMALISGDVQINMSGGVQTINAKLKGSNVTLVGTTVGVMPFSFYVSKRISRTADLKGKRVGVSGLGGMLDHATRSALQQMGLNPQVDVTVVQIGMPLSNSVTAMVTGAIDGSILYPPESFKADELGFKLVVDLAQSGIKFPTNQIATTPEYIKRNRENVKKFMMGYIAGVARLKADREFTMKVFNKFLRISDPQQLVKTYDFWVSIYPPKAYVDPGELETYLSNVKDRGRAKPQDFIDNSIVTELDREGFIDAIYRKYAK
jgi:NitT/TauT family transport system substrate-binding protein